MDHFILKGGGGEVGQIRKNSCTTFAEEIKIANSITKPRNILQASEIKLYEAFSQEKNSCRKKCPPPPPLKNIMVHL